MLVGCDLRCTAWCVHPVQYRIRLLCDSWKGCLQRSLVNEAWHRWRTVDPTSMLVQQVVSAHNGMTGSSCQNPQVHGARHGMAT